MELKCLLAITLLAGTVEVVSGDVIEFLRSTKQSGTKEPSPHFQAHGLFSTSESAAYPKYDNVSAASSLPITPIPNPSDFWADGEVYLLSVDNICDLMAISKCLATSNQVCNNQGQPTASGSPPNPAITAHRESTNSESTLHPSSTNFERLTASEPPPNPAIIAHRESTNSESTLHPSSTNFERLTASEPPPNPAIIAHRESTNSESTLHPSSTNFERLTDSQPLPNPAIAAHRESTTSESTLHPSSTNFERLTDSQPPPNPAIAPHRESTTSESTSHSYSTNYRQPTKSEPASNPDIVADRESKTSGTILAPTTHAPASYSGVKTHRQPPNYALSYEYILL